MPDQIQFSTYVQDAKSYEDKLPVLCTNSAPLSRSNVTSYDTSRQVTIDTPGAGLLRGFRDKFGFRFLGINYAEPTSGEARFEPPTMLKVEKGTERDALKYGPMCAQVENLHCFFLCALLFTDFDTIVFLCSHPVS